MASLAVKQPAVFGSSVQPASFSTSTIEPRAAGSTRRSARVARSAPDARTASPITSRLRKPPVPMISRERKLRPAIVSPSATLHRPDDLYALALVQRHLVPQLPRNHLAVERDGHAAALARPPARGHRLAHGRVGGELPAFAVQDHSHAIASAKRAAPNGSTDTGGSSPVTMAATAVAVIGAS